MGNTYDRRLKEFEQRLGRRLEDKEKEFIEWLARKERERTNTPGPCNHPATCKSAD